MNAFKSPDLLASDFLQPLYLVDAGDFAQARHDLFEVFEVGDVENDLDAGLAIGSVCADVADVALRVADDAGDVFEHAETIVAVDGELDGVGGGRGVVAGPLHIDTALRFVHQVCNVGTVHRMHGDA